MTITRLRAWITRTPFLAPVTWTVGGTEDAAFHLWLELTGADGTTGLSETPVKPAWTGLDGETALAAVRHLVAPRVLGEAPRTEDGALSDVRGLSVFKAAVGHALADLRTPGPAITVPVCVVLTRDTPEAMAASARRAIAVHGVRALKVKAGQGLDSDGAALAMVRRELGDGGRLSIDANSAYDAERGLGLCELAAEHGADFVEDPWPLAPDAATGHSVARAACAIAADRVAGDEALIGGLFEQGLSWVAVKPNRIGPAAARRFAANARSAGVGVVSGLFGEGPLGALQQLRGETGDTPCEATHFLELCHPVPVTGLELAGGQISAPPGRASELVSVADVTARSVGSVEATS